MRNILKQAQEMQTRLAKLQLELEQCQVVGQAGGGMVEVTMTGKQVVQKVRIDPSVVSANDVEMLEDLVVAAVNDGLKKIQEMTQSRMAQVTGGLNIPGMNLPF